jgi:pimeloyl-[acyl-carrier protein] synthase
VEATAVAGELGELSSAMERYLVDPATRDNPYAMFARLRELDPVHETASGAWVFTRYHDVNEILRDARWSRWEAAKHEYGEPPPDDEPMARGIEVTRQMMINRDDPDHKRIRRLVSKAFTPKAIENWKPLIARVVDRLIESVRDRDEFDILKELGYPLPEIVICELLGVPTEDHSLWKEWIDVMVGANRMSRIVGDPLDLARKAAVELVGYFGDLCAHRRTDPRDDLVTALVQVESEGEHLNEAELIGTVIMLVAGGHETTANFVGNGMACLLREPDQYTLLRDAPALLPSALEELLRYEGPARHPLPRRATENIVLGDRVIPEGATGLVLVNAANRDPEVFSDPERLDIRRSDNRHIAFGAGSHFCLGAPLARLEASRMFDAIIRRLPRLEMVESPRWSPTFLRALEGLRVAPGA